MTKLVLESRGMSFESMNNKLCMEKSDLGNFRFYGVVDVVDSYGLCDRYELEITTHERRKHNSDGTYETVVDTYVDTSCYVRGECKRDRSKCFYCEPTKQALLSEINKRFGMDYTEIEIV